MVTKAQRPTTDEDAAEGPGLADQIAGAVLLPVEVARRVLPEHGAPVYLGIGALVIVDLIDWPVAVASGLGYFLLKRWRTPRSAASARK